MTYRDFIIEAFGQPIGESMGLPTTRRGSNLRAVADDLRARHPRKWKHVYAVAGAHRWRGTEGWYWYFYPGIYHGRAPRGLYVQF